MRFDKIVHEALSSTDELLTQLVNDFDVDRGSFTWWHDYDLDRTSLIGMMDYLCGLVVGVAMNLRGAAVHLADLIEQRYADDLWIMTGFRQNGRHPRRGDLEDRRGARIEVHALGVLRATGSVLDTLAGVVVGVGGFDADLIRAELGWLMPFVAGPDYPGTQVRGRLRLKESVLEPLDRQGVFLRAVQSSLLEAGPAGWIEWATWSRHDGVHRASRVQPLVVVDNRTLARPLPRQPRYSEGHAMRTAGTFEQMQLTEDSISTLRGLLESLNVAVAGAMAACINLWEYRRQHPEAIMQPAGQWRTGRSPATSVFEGYAPGSAKPPDGSIVVAPMNLSRRWHASQVLDGYT